MNHPTFTEVCRDILIAKGFKEVKIVDNQSDDFGLITTGQFNVLALYFHTKEQLDNPLLRYAVADAASKSADKITVVLCNTVFTAEWLEMFASHPEIEHLDQNNLAYTIGLSVPLLERLAEWALDRVVMSYDTNTRYAPRFSKVYDNRANDLKSFAAQRAFLKAFDGNIFAVANLLKSTGLVDHYELMQDALSGNLLKMKLSAKELKDLQKHLYTDYVTILSSLLHAKLIKF